MTEWTTIGNCPDCNTTKITHPIDLDYVTCKQCGLYHYIGDRT